jgi:outer membrane immunogenic protein
MQKTLVAATVAALFGITGAASAADVYPGGLKDAPVYVAAGPWSGFYFGANGGYGETESISGIALTTGPITGGHTITASLPGFDEKGAFGGGQAGFNWQRDHIVFGIETDLQASAIQSDKTVNPALTTTYTGGAGAIIKAGGPLLNTHLAASEDWFGTVRGRLGYAYDNVLLYVTGGFAYAGVNEVANTTIVGILPLAQASKHGVDTGWVLGGGFEYKASQNWSFKVEYQYIDLGTDHLTGSAVAFVPLNSNNLNNDISTVRLGINYHVAPAYEPLK